MTPAPTRLRARFTKVGKLRWTSHRDVARMWERALRKVGLPVAYSAGFSPRPRVSFGLALPTGHESEAEYLDIDVLDAPSDLAVTAEALAAALPAGLDVTALAVVDRSEPSLQEDVTSCTWRWAAVPALAAPGEVPGPVPAALVDPEAAVAALLARPELVVTRTRKGREHTEDIRPSILDVRVLPGPPPDAEVIDDRHVWFEAELASQPRSIRPIEVVRALDEALDERHVRRLHQWIWRHGARLEPLVPEGRHGLVAAPGAPHALERAS